jgi:DNA polymerase-3 subunit beta
MRLIEGDFPDYQQVVPKEHTHRIEFPRDELLSALRRILILTTERSRGIKLQFEKDKIEISVNTPDVGEGTEEIAASYAGDGLSIGFNGRYLTEALHVMNEGDSVVLFLKDEMSPGLLQQKDSHEFSYVIMPMKIN